MEHYTIGRYTFHALKQHRPQASQRLSPKKAGKPGDEASAKVLMHTPDAAECPAELHRLYCNWLLPHFDDTSITSSGCIELLGGAMQWCSATQRKCI